ncbi:MAG: glycosyltransferase [Planctomycetota bacterium]|nr:glycosyltransferase [Planctomycetota bacterium]
MRLAVLIPCHNEAAVIARKLRNLAAARFPDSSEPHVVVVIDDGSSDATAAVARAELAVFGPKSGATARIEARVIANDVRPGKTGAIEAGLRAVAGRCDLVVLTDADVVLAPAALLELARAFERDPRLGMATGTQRFVRSLCDDGTLRAADGNALQGEPSFYDWAAARVRRLESRSGLVFSVHGQLMAWRASLALVPTAGVAADDLDLMLQARSAGQRIEQVAGAVFCEVRAPKGDARRQQAVRRARAYHQFLRHPRIDELRERGSWLARRQASLYLQAGRARGPWTILAMGSIFLAGWHFGPTAAIVVTCVDAALFLPPWILMRIVRSRMEVAEALEARSRMGERWETARR